MSLNSLPITTIDDPHTLFQMFCRSCRIHSDKNAYIYRAGDQQIEVTFQKLFEDVLLLAGAFNRKGVARGDRVMFLADNRYGWIVTDLALMSLGAISVPRGSDTPGQELLFIMENSKCTHLIIETEPLFEQHRPNLKKMGALKNVFIMAGPAIHSFFGKTYSYQDLLKDRTYSERDVERFLERGLEIDGDDLLTVIYTSGTTGMPKGVMLTHSNIMHNVRCIPGIIELTPEDRWLSVLPTWHIFERTAEYVALAGGCCLVYSSVKTFAQDLVDYRPTVVATVPRIWESLHNRVLAALRKKGAAASAIFNFLVRVSAKFRRNRRVLLDQLPQFHHTSSLHRFLRKTGAALN